MSSQVTSFRVERYRSFAREQVVDLAPLTLLFGHNNAGKSALLRVLPLLAEAVEAARGPLNLDGDVLRRGNVQNLLCQAPESRWLRFGVGFGEDRSMAVELRREGPRLLDVEWVEHRRDGNVQRWERDPGVPFDTQFRAFLPLAPDGSEPLDDLRRVLREVQWLRGLRVTPERWRNLPAGLPRKVATDGTDAADWLADDEGSRAGTPSPGSIGEQVAAFLERVGLRFAIEERNDQYTVLLSASSTSAPRIPLVDSGEGYIQVFPVLVAVARAMLGVGPPLVAVEQPELHLHTMAQRALGEWLADLAAKPGPASILVETHSEVLLTAVQLAVATGRLAPERVGIWWVRRGEDGASEAAPMRMTREGRLEGDWPADPWREVSELTRALHQARKRGA